MATGDDTPEVEYRSISWLPDYRFGSDGSVESSLRGTWRKLKGKANKRNYGHVQVDLKVPREGRRKSLYVHRLILEAFLGPCPDGMQARHFPDPDPSNNRIENLSWGTPLENASDRKLHGHNQTGEKNRRAKLDWDKVYYIRKSCSSGESYSSLATRFGVDESTIRHVVRGKTWIS